ncbi:PAS domain-containing sensor histidine kinase [Herbaspirillum sp. YR522]|uniref:hybrid sensor histidine kinase/response regulator n=1 Tax=Herbaspirillum sp. YR522 TaxID=1144342 RepID=UPI00026F7671|nr:PAS domain-containing sensor histidine kinase [Herbaspirillum sp. YR522]EJN08144.1 PAS domain S-box [Herbaspirillum sp. YR522]
MTAPDSSDRFPFLAHGGHMGAAIAAFDWSATPLGPLSQWPAHLRTATSIMLASDRAMVMMWGRTGILVFNDAYAASAGHSRRRELGLPVQQAWPEVADFNSNVLDVVLAGGTLGYRDQRMMLQRDVGLEDSWLCLDYSAVRDEQGVPCGVLVILEETTARVHVEQRLSIAQAAGGVGTFEWFPDSGRLEVSDQYLRLWNLPPGTEVTDALLLRLLHPDDVGVAGVKRLDDRGNPLAYSEFRRVDPDTGEVRWLARRGEVVSSPESGRRRYVGVIADITERRQTEQALRDSEQRWRNLFEQMREGFFIGQAVRAGNGAIADFRMVTLNPAFQQQTGIDTAWAEGRMMSEITPSIRDELTAIYSAVLDGNRRGQFEIQVPELENRWFEVRAQRIDEDSFAALFIDISGRKTAEQLIIESEWRFRSFAQSMPNHVWTATPGGELDWFNDRVHEYAGAAAGPLQGAGWLRLLHADDRARHAQAWQAAIAGGTGFEIEYRLLRHDGAYRWHIGRAVPMRSSSGEIERWIGSNTDIEAQKVAEAALSQLAANLEQRVEERTGELLATQETLRHSQKMEALGKLTGGVAHDFNNLLQVISGNLQLLTRELGADARAGRRITNALAGVARGARLASQLLAFGRRQPLEPKVLNLSRLVMGIDDMLRRALGEAIEIEIVTAGGLWNTFADPAQVENALLNLAINGRDAMTQGGRLTIELRNAWLDDAYVEPHAELRAGQYVMLAVSDTGSGIPAEVLEHVFEPFFTTKPEGQGTGLGLSMVYGFAKQSGGHVAIYSEPGQGTTVKLYLPRNEQAEDIVNDHPMPPAEGGNETILVAEDDDEVSATVVELLSELGYRVLKARDAEAALSIIDSGIGIDLLFTDVVMPGRLKSPEMARQARERIPRLAVLFTSGYTDNAIVHGGRLEPGVELLSKPYTREALAHKVRSVLVQQRRRDGA